MSNVHDVNLKDTCKVCGKAFPIDIITLTIQKGVLLSIFMLKGY